MLDLAASILYRTWREHVATYCKIIVVQSKYFRFVRYINLYLHLSGCLFISFCGRSEGTCPATYHNNNMGSYCSRVGPNRTYFGRVELVAEMEMSIESYFARYYIKTILIVTYEYYSDASRPHGILRIQI